MEEEVMTIRIGDLSLIQILEECKHHACCDKCPLHDMTPNNMLCIAIAIDSYEKYLSKEIEVRYEKVNID